MSAIVTGLLWQITGMTAVQKLVIIKLGDHAWDDGSNVFPGQKSVAENCGCSVRTVQRVIDWATEQGMLIEDDGPKNRVRKYRFDMDWIRQRVRVTESQGDSQSCSGRQGVTLDATHSQAINKEPSTNRKEPSKKATVKIPFSSVEFLEAWETWKQHLKEKKKPLTKSSQEYQWRQLAKTTEADAIARIVQSIECNWTGLFPVKGNPSLKVEQGGKPDNQDGDEFSRNWRPS